MSSNYNKRFTYCSATLGCKVNQAETAELETELYRGGWSAVKDNPDVYLVNTCAVTAVSEAKSRRLINRLIRENPASRIVVTGCYASRNPAEISRHIRAGFDVIVPQKDKKKIPSLLKSQLPLTKPQALISNGQTGSLYSLQERPRRDRDRSAQNGCNQRTRAFLRIQDGCDNYCSYCIVPLLRGNPESKSLNQVVDEAKDLVNRNYREIVLVGINLGNYPQLPNLLKQLVLIKGLLRIRLSSMEVRDISNELLSLMQISPNICPHLHIPLQSGSNKVLKAMNRRYTAEEYIEKIKLIKKQLDKPAITTDIIVGFPGEADSDFQDTLNISRKASFSKIHIFPYSPRPGTDAERLTGKVSLPIIKERIKKLNNLQRELALSCKKQFIGEKVTILLESKGQTGFTAQYLKVRLKGQYPDKINQLAEVLVKEATSEYLTGTLTGDYL